MAAEETEAKSKTTRLGDFELKKKLGQGGMGAVYLAHQLSLDRKCALKIMAKELAAKPGFVERFVREARSMAKIAHPNVVSCYAVGNDQGHHYVAMELIDGKSMQDWANKIGQLSVADAVLVTIVCGEALHYAHELNMVHRDVKPDNILITSKGIVKVSDLGLAKAVDDEDLALTQSGAGLGTPHYMAPEQARNAKHVDRRCDVYALGCTLYFFLTGKTPFQGESLVELITNKTKGKFTPARQLNKNVSERLSLMIDKAMAPDPKNRYAGCEEFAKDLESLGLAGESLSFISEDQRVTLRRGGGSAGSNARTQVNRGGTTLPGAGKPDAKPAGVVAEAQWYVNFQDPQGKTKVGKMSTPQVLQAIKTDKFNEQTRLAQNAKGPFVPLVQFPVFEEDARKMLARKAAAERGKDLSKQYNKLAKQYERQWIWKWLRAATVNTFGFIGLILWIGLFVALGFAVWFFWPRISEFISQQMGG